MIRPVTVVRQAMAAGSLGLAVGSVVAPGLLGRVAGVSPRTARLLGLRDAVVGVALLRGGGTAPLVARGLSDVGDALLLARRRPPVAAFAAASGIANLVAAGAQRRRAR